MPEDLLQKGSVLSSKKQILIFVLIVVLGIMIGLFILFKLKPFQREEEIVKKQPIPITMEQEQGGLLRLAQFRFPKIAEKNVVEKSELPSEIQGLILKQANNITATNLKYVNNQEGYLVSYNYQISGQDLMEFEKALRSRNLKDKFQIVKAIRSDLFGFIELASSDNHIRVSYKRKESNEKDIKVEIQTLKIQ